MTTVVKNGRRAGIVGVVARDESVAAILLSAVPASRRIPLPDLFPWLESGDRPRALLLGAGAIDAGILRRLKHLQARGFVPPTAVYCPRVDDRFLRLVWEGERIEARLVLRTDDVASAARRLLDVPASSCYALHRLQTTFDCSCPIVARVIHLLSTETAVASDRIGRIAVAAALSRTALFAAFRRADLPTPERIQLLFTLDASFQAMLRTGSTKIAARAGGFADARALRAALERLGVGVKAMKDATERGWLFDLWLSRERDRRRCGAAPDPA